MTKLKFSKYQLIVDDQSFSKGKIDLLSKHLATINQSGKAMKINENYCQVKHVEYFKDFLCFEIAYGDNRKYSESVFDCEKEEFGMNPKSRSQVEPNAQLFCFLGIEKIKGVWISNSRAKTMLIQLIENSQAGNFILAKEVIDQEEFLKSIKTIDSTRFVINPENLFEDRNYTEIANNIFGFGAKAVYELQATFRKGTGIEGIVDSLRALFKKHQDCKIEELVVCGKNADGITQVLNIDGLSSAIMLNDLAPDENGHFAFERVRDEFMKLVFNEKT